MKLFLTAFFSLCIFTSVAFVNPSYAADDKGKEGEPTVHFIELNPLIVPVITANGATQMVSLVVAVEVDSQEKADKVTKFSPRLTDAYLSELYGAFAHKAPENGIIPISYVKERLNKTSGKILGDETVSDVLVQVLQSRRT
jgi:flagellar FliL protein